MSTADTEDFVTKVVAWHLAKGRPSNCAMIVWLQEQAGRSDTDTIRAEMVARDDWEPAYSIEALAAVLQMHAPDKAATLQALYAEDIASAVYDGVNADQRRLRDRAALERLLRDGNEEIADAAWPFLLTWFTTNHPNPKLFFDQAPVLAKVPTDVVLTALPCPARPAFADTPLQGERETEEPS